MSSDGSWPIATAMSRATRLAVMGGPARQQPWRHIERLGFDLVDQRLPLARAAAQHGIDEPGIFRGAPVRLHQPHRRDRPRHDRAHPSREFARRRSTTRSARAAHRSECRDRADATAHGPGCRAVAGWLRPAAASGRGRDRKGSSVRDARRRRRAVRRACAACAGRRQEYPLRSAAPQDRALRMAVRIVEEAWEREHLGNDDRVFEHRCIERNNKSDMRICQI